MFRILSVAALVACTALPAAADGQISLSFHPRTAEQAAALRAGLALYALHKDIETNGHVTQRGIGNAAGIYQRGGGHRGIIEQRGRRHDGSITQSGRGNSYGLFQSGRGTSAHVVQRGYGRAGLSFVHGW